MPRPTFVFDGDCGICRTWVDYWRQLTGDKVAYRPYQEAAADFPAIPAGDFKHAVQLIEPDGAVYAGAAATFRLLSYAPDRGAWWWLYRYVPGFAALSEAAYRLHLHAPRTADAARRTCCGAARSSRRATISSRGCSCAGSASSISPRSSPWRCRSAASSAATASCRSASTSTAAHAGWGTDAYWRLPTLFWLNASRHRADGRRARRHRAEPARHARHRRSASRSSACVALYLSFVYAGQLFFTYQWDMLLVEAGFLAIFLTGGSVIVVWLYRLLLFRFLFLAGLVKLASGDATWQQLTALDYHFFTQPLPSPLAFYAAQLPHWLLAAATADRARHRARRRGADLPAAPPAHARRRAGHRFPARDHARPAAIIGSTC